jgi:hypothetical protein
LRVQLSRPLHRARALGLAGAALAGSVAGSARAQVVEVDARGTAFVEPSK